MLLEPAAAFRKCASRAVWALPAAAKLTDNHSADMVPEGLRQDPITEPDDVIPTSLLLHTRHLIWQASVGTHWPLVSTACSGVVKRVLPQHI